jgi:hypothetical protein
LQRQGVASEVGTAVLDTLQVQRALSVQQQQRVGSGRDQDQGAPLMMDQGAPLMMDQGAPLMMDQGAPVMMDDGDDDVAVRSATLREQLTALLDKQDVRMPDGRDKQRRAAGVSEMSPEEVSRARDSEEHSRRQKETFHSKVAFPSSTAAATTRAPPTPPPPDASKVPAGNQTDAIAMPEGATNTRLSDDRDQDQRRRHVSTAGPLGEGTDAASDGGHEGLFPPAPLPPGPPPMNALTMNPSGSLPGDSRAPLPLPGFRRPY